MVIGPIIIRIGKENEKNGVFVLVASLFKSDKEKLIKRD